MADELDFYMEEYVFTGDDNFTDTLPKYLGKSKIFTFTCSEMTLAHCDGWECYLENQIEAINVYVKNLYPSEVEMEVFMKIFEIVSKSKSVRKVNIVMKAMLPFCTWETVLVLIGTSPVEELALETGHFGLFPLHKFIEQSKTGKKLICSFSGMPSLDIPKISQALTDNSTLQQLEFKTGFLVTIEKFEMFMNILDKHQSLTSVQLQSSSTKPIALSNFVSTLGTIKKLDYLGDSFAFAVGPNKTLIGKNFQIEDSLIDLLNKNSTIASLSFTKSEIKHPDQHKEVLTIIKDRPAFTHLLYLDDITESASVYTQILPECQYLTDLRLNSAVQWSLPPNLKKFATDKIEGDMKSYCEYLSKHSSLSKINTEIKSDKNLLEFLASCPKNLRNVNLAIGETTNLGKVGKLLETNQNVRSLLFFRVELEEPEDFLEFMTGISKNDSLESLILNCFDEIDYLLPKALDLLSQNYSLTKGNVQLFVGRNNFAEQFKLICNRNKLIKEQKRFKTVKKVEETELAESERTAAQDRS